MIKINSTNIYLVNSATTHIILRSKIYFTHLVTQEASVNTIIGSTKMIEGSRRATILFFEKSF